jgi:hypothetical protein
MAQSPPVWPGTEHDTVPHLPGLPAQGNSKGRRSGLAPTTGFRTTAHRMGHSSSPNHEPRTAMRQWASLAGDQCEKIEAVVRRNVPVRDDFVQIPFPRLADLSGRQIAAAVESYKREAAIVDARLSREVTLQQKATALSDLCERLRADTGIQLGAGSSVAEEKVTLFCEKVPLRDVMRQLSRPFGYAWLRSGAGGGGEYRYELVQDLRSQLLEEELRNRDRNAALLALESEIGRYRPYLGLSPDEALARSKTAAPAEKKLIEKLAGAGWGPIQMYFRLSNRNLAELRAGRTLRFSGAPDPGEQSLAPELARGVLQSYRDWRVRQVPGAESFYRVDPTHPEDPPLAAIPELRASITLTMTQSELGEFTLDGSSTVFFPKGFGAMTLGTGPYASGRSPAVLKPDNRAANLKLAGDPMLRRRVLVQPQASCGVNLSPQPPPRNGEGEPVSTTAASPKPRLPSPFRGGAGGEVNPKVTTADVLEVLHQATGLPIVADYYTRLYKPSVVSVRNLALFEALNQLADAMRLRWTREGNWLQLRSASFYDDRLKEVPNRLLARWSAARRQQGMLTLDDLLEIAHLSEAQLDASEMAEGARDCFGLTEWDLARHPRLRPHLRYLATFTPDQRRIAMSTDGLPFTRMSLAQQQQFIAFALRSEPLSPQELQGAALRVDYSQPGGFQWGDPGISFTPAPWVVLIEPGREGRWLPRPSLRGRTRDAVMQAVLRLDPTIRERAMLALQLRRARPEPEAREPLEAQIFPTDLSLNFIYLPATSNRLPVHIVGSKGWDTWQTLF